jgi:hypothetical protein
MPDEARVAAIVRECRDQSRNCIYTSTTLFIWLRFLRTIRTVFIVVPIVFGAIASGTLLTDTSDGPNFLVAIFAFVAGVTPAIYRGLKLDRHLAQCSRLAGEFKNLQDAFRQCADISSLKPIDEFEAEFKALMRRLEAARRPSYTAPEWCFKRAQKKVQAGDYDPDPQPATPASTPNRV